MFIELHAPNGTKVYHNVDQVIAIGLCDNQTNIFYNDTTFVVKETMPEVVKMVEQAKIICRQRIEMNDDMGERIEVEN